MAQKGILVKRNSHGAVVSSASAVIPQHNADKIPPSKEHETFQQQQLHHSDVRFEISVNDESEENVPFVASSSPTGSGSTLVTPGEGCNGVTPESNYSDSGTGGGGSSGRGGGSIDSGGSSRVGRVTFSAPSPNTSPRVSPTRQDHNRLRVEFVGMEDVEKNKQEVENDLKHVHKRGVGRLHQPRMSLLGKPLNYRAHKRDARYRRSQAKVYNFLERPKDWRAISYHLLV